MGFYGKLKNKIRNFSKKTLDKHKKSVYNNKLTEHQRSGCTVILERTVSLNDHTADKTRSDNQKRILA